MKKKVRPWILSSYPNSDSVLISSHLPMTAEVPLLMLFTVNFTVTNLPYVEDMGCPGSEIFNYTEKTLQRVVRACSPTPPPC
jgi:hypothetical protein